MLIEFTVSFGLHEPQLLPWVVSADAIQSIMQHNNWDNYTVVYVVGQEYTVKEPIQQVRDKWETALRGDAHAD